MLEVLVQCYWCSEPLVSLITAAKISDHIYWLASNDAGRFLSMGKPNSDHVRRTLYNLSGQQAQLRQRISKLTRKRYSSSADNEELQRQSNL